MMNHAYSRSTMPFRANDTGLIRRQLQREISCLERQLERIRRVEEFRDLVTLQTYEEMINSRKEMLADL